MVCIGQRILCVAVMKRKPAALCRHPTTRHGQDQAAPKRADWQSLDRAQLSRHHQTWREQNWDHACKTFLSRSTALQSFLQLLDLSVVAIDWCCFGCCHTSMLSSSPICPCWLFACLYKTCLKMRLNMCALQPCLSAHVHLLTLVTWLIFDTACTHSNICSDYSIWPNWPRRTLVACY